MTEKKRLRLTAGKRQVPPIPKEPRLVIRKKKSPHPEQERPLDHPGHLRNGEEAEAPESNPPYRAVTKELETTSPTDRSSKPDFALSPAPAGVVIGTDVDSGEPVALPYQTRDLGVTVVGQTGYGKTTLLEQLILHDIAQGTSVIVVDAHGDLTKRILSLADTDEANLLLLEAWEDAPFRLHLFDCADPASPLAVDRTVSGVVQVFKKLFGSPREFYPRLERDLGNAARTVITNGGTLPDVPRLFWDTDFRAAALAGVTNRQVREFWARWERIGRADRQLDQLEATINRLDQFLASEFVAAVVGSTTTTIPLDEVLSGDGQALLVSLPVGDIGEGLTNLLGSLFLAVLTERIFARARLEPVARPRVHLYLDEYGRYATPTTAQLLTEGRKFAVGTTIAHQTRAQILDEENRAAELQVGALVCFQLIGADAEELAGEFRITPEPQWEERVEEIEGEEPELAIPPNPAELLRTSGHPDPVIRDLVRGFLVPLYTELAAFERLRQSAGSRTSPATGYHPEIDLGWSIRGIELKDTCKLVEKAIVDSMEQRIDNVPGRVLRILTAYWKRIAPPQPQAAYSPKYYLPDLKMNARWSGMDPDIPSDVHLHRCIGGVIARADATIAAGGVPVFTESDKAELVAELHKIHVHWYRGDKKEPPEEFERLAGIVGHFVYSLLVLLHRLVAEPLLVPTGRVRPRKRIRYITHPQRSYQDVQNELAVELASLPRFTAYCNVQGEQHRVRLSSPAEGDIDEERIKRIRQASKARFGRPPEKTEPSVAPGVDDFAPARRIRRHLDEGAD